MSGLACSCRMPAWPPISHPRRWLCSLSWHECVHVRRVIGQLLTVRVSHPNLLCALLTHQLRVVVFFYCCSHFHYFWGTYCLVQKNIRATVKWLPIVALQKSCQTIGFLEFLANFTLIIIMEQKTKTIQHVTQIKH